MVFAVLRRMPARRAVAWPSTPVERQGQGEPLRGCRLHEPPLLAADAAQLETIGDPRDAIDTVGCFHKPAPASLCQRLPRGPDPIESRHAPASDIPAFAITERQPGNAHDVTPGPMDLNIDADLAATRHGARHPSARV